MFTRSQLKFSVATQQLASSRFAMKNWPWQREVRYGHAVTVKNSMPPMANRSLWSIKTVTDPYEQAKCVVCMENSSLDKPPATS
jgi:galactose-1-phosphate uridylyltransferase